MKKLVVLPNNQRADLFDKDVLLKSYSISTAINGMGCDINSNCTPFGTLRVAEKIGDGFEIGSIFKARVPTGEVWQGVNSDEDLVLTRILWLEGVETINSNTKQRFIYLHGTNQEHLLGQPASHGCIRFSNKDIIEIFEFLEIGDEVFVTF